MEQEQGTGRPETESSWTRSLIAKPEAKSEGKAERLPEPWLRGTHSELAPVERAVLHSLEMAREDTLKWCGGLDDAELGAEPCGLASVAFQLRHIARSLDRFMTYAEGQALNSAQLAALAAEKEAPAGGNQEALSELADSLDVAQTRLLAHAGWPLERPVKIGRKGLLTTVGGLLVHMAEHTQRHVGQAITTAKAVIAQRPG